MPGHPPTPHPPAPPSGLFRCVVTHRRSHPLIGGYGAAIFKRILELDSTTASQLESALLRAAATDAVAANADASGAGTGDGGGGGGGGGSGGGSGGGGGGSSVGGDDGGNNKLPAPIVSSIAVDNMTVEIELETLADCRRRLAHDILAAAPAASMTASDDGGLGGSNSDGVLNGTDLPSALASLAARIRGDGIAGGAGAAGTGSISGGHIGDPQAILEQLEALALHDDADSGPTASMFTCPLHPSVANICGVLLLKHSDATDPTATPTSPSTPPSSPDDAGLATVGPLVLVSTARLNMRNLAAAAATSAPVLLVGAAGSGKTSTLRALAHATGRADRLLELHLDDSLGGCGGG